MKVAFLGTPEFALPSLALLIERGYDLAVFTQPDRPVGRKMVMTAPPVKRYAMEHALPVCQFERIRSAEGVEALGRFAPDLMITAAFGQLLSKENLDIPRLGCINVHGSILPKYRGAAPIQWSLINGETETGVTTMMTDVGMDTGDILCIERTTIDPNETAGELFDRLSILGAKTLARTLDALESGTLTRQKQDDALATKCCMLKKEHGKLDFSQSARQVHNRVRGTNPDPGAFALLDGVPLKIWRTRTLDRPSSGLAVGTCFLDGKSGLLIQCGDGVIEVLELQAQGAKRMSTGSFLAGRKLDGKVLQ